MVLRHSIRVLGLTQAEGPALAAVDHLLDLVHKDLVLKDLGQGSVADLISTTFLGFLPAKRGVVAAVQVHSRKKYWLATILKSR